MANKNKYPRRRTKKATEIVNQARVVDRAEAIEEAYMKECTRVTLLRETVHELLDVLGNPHTSPKEKQRVRLEAHELLRKISRDQ